MAKTKTRSNKETKDYLSREIIAALLFTIGIFSALSIIFYSSKTGFDVKGAMGSIGLFISTMLGKAFGISSIIIPVVMFYSAIVIFFNKEGSGLYRKAISAFIFLISTMTLLGLVFAEGDFLGYAPAGGLAGMKIADFLKNDVAGTVGSYLIATILLLISLIIITNIKISDIIDSTGKMYKMIGNSIVAGSRYMVHLGKQSADYLGTLVTQKRTERKPDIEREIVFDDPAQETHLNGSSQTPTVLKPSAETTTNPTQQENANGLPQIVIEEHKNEKPEQLKLIKESERKNFKLPPVDLLDPKQEGELEVDKEAVYKKAQLIEAKLEDFGVLGKVTEIRPGPVITMFEYKPAPGIKINKIASLESDLAMGLSAFSIRIIAPIPGKDVIGIEVPNAKREVVVLREMLENAEFSNSKSLLTLALGKDISGMPFYMDLRKAPHLMIAGTTGSGKSVLLNAVITSMLYKASPYELKFIMIDPKMLELSVYEDIPHLLHPVVTDPKKAAAALRWAVEEMENRYRILSEEGVRDIETHNRNVEKMDDEDKLDKLLPYIVIVLDELADLMMISPSEIKESITRLAQKARAAGIHLIVATQRPSADIVAGLIKANFPARISFLVSSKVDSRIILDAGGAERLLGKGDMLFLKPGTSILLRVQGALISDEEREAITKHLKEQGPPIYNEEITLVEDTESSAELDDEKDELYYDALRTIAETRQASISMLQRRLKIGYNRAARIVEIMEREGVVGPQEVAGKPREVFIDLNQIEEREAN